MEAENPSLYLTKMTKAARKEKIYLDYLRNERGATAVAPYSPRARAGIPASVPLAWSELKSGNLPQFRVVDFSNWKSRVKNDPWVELTEIVQTLNIQ
jgi:bifunctional non-homologous end joining protein LigD